MKRTTASFKRIKGSKGTRYMFYCDLSGVLVCTTREIQSVFDDKELMTVWKAEGEQHFNKCHKCGRWVIDAMYNAEVLECVSCAPYELEKDFHMSSGDKLIELESFGFGPNAMKKHKVCSGCGHMILTEEQECPLCGNKLTDQTLYDLYKKMHDYCPDCDTVLPDGTFVCPHCGCNLKENVYALHAGSG